MASEEKPRDPDQLSFTQEQLVKGAATLTGTGYTMIGATYGAALGPIGFVAGGIAGAIFGLVVGNKIAEGVCQEYNRQSQ